MLLKPGKTPTELKSHRPISLLPIISKAYEKFLLGKLKLDLETKTGISKYPIISDEFGFTSPHTTVEQLHRVIEKIGEDLEKKRFSGISRLKPIEASK